jgi:hypothetical protein
VRVGAGTELTGFVFACTYFSRTYPSTCAKRGKQRTPPNVLLFAVFLGKEQRRGIVGRVNDTMYTVYTCRMALLLFAPDEHSPAAPHGQLQCRTHQLRCSCLFRVRMYTGVGLHTRKLILCCEFSWFAFAESVDHAVPSVLSPFRAFGHVQGEARVKWATIRIFLRTSNRAMRSFFEVATGAFVVLQGSKSPCILIRSNFQHPRIIWR